MTSCRPRDATSSLYLWFYFQQAIFWIFYEGDFWRVTLRFYPSFRAPILTLFRPAPSVFLTLFSWLLFIFLKFEKCHPANREISLFFIHIVMFTPCISLIVGTACPPNRSISQSNKKEGGVGFGCVFRGARQVAKVERCTCTGGDINFDVFTSKLKFSWDF